MMDRNIENPTLYPKKKKINQNSLKLIFDNKLQSNNTVLTVTDHKYEKVTSYYYF